MTIKRNVVGAALVLMFGAAGCGDDDNNGNNPVSPSSQDAVAVIANNHNHLAVVTAAQISAGRPVSIDIRGTADHGHLLDLTNDDMVRLANRQRVERDSSPQNNHTHRITFN